MSDASTDASGSAPRVLCVDDDPGVVGALRRELEAAGFIVETAETARGALAALERDPPPDAVIADLYLPDADGISVLADAARRDADGVRILVTGYADFDASLRAINEGHVYAFVEKPWQRHDLTATLRAGLEHRRATRDRDALVADAKGQNPSGEFETGKALLMRFTALETASKQGHGARLAEMLRGLCEHLGLRRHSIEEIALAARLHDLGEATLPAAAHGVPEQQLDGERLAAYRRHPEIMASVLDGIPGMARVATIIRLHHERWDGQGFPDGRRENAIPAPVRVFRVVDAFDEAVHGNLGRGPMGIESARLMIERGSAEQFDPRAASAFLRWQAQQSDARDGADPDEVSLQALQPGMVLTNDLTTRDGTLLVPAGHRLNTALLQRIRALGDSFPDDLRVRVRRNPATSAAR